MNIKIKKTSDSLISNVKWTTVSSIILTVAYFMQFIVLSKTTTIKEMAILSVSTTLIGVAQLLSDGGLSNAIIHFREISNKALNTLFGLNILIAFILFSVINIFSNQISSFFGYNDIAFFLLIISLNFLLIAVGQQAYVLLQKKMLFQIIAKIEVLSSLLSLIAFIILIKFSFTVIFAFLVSQNVNYGAKAILFLLVNGDSKRNYFSFSIKESKKMLNYGVMQLFDRGLNFLYIRLDVVIIGGVLGPYNLGLYTFAYNIVIVPISRISPIVNRVMLPYYATFQKDMTKLKETFLSSTKVIVYLNSIIYLILFGTTSNLVLLLGDQWERAIPIMYIMILTSILKSVNNPIGPMIYAIGELKKSVFYNITKIFFLLPVLAVAYYTENLIAVVITFLVIQLFLCFYSLKILVTPILYITSTSFIKNITRPSVFCLSSFLLVYLLEQLISLNNNLIELILMIVITLIIGGGFFIFIERKNFTLTLWRKYYAKN